MRVLAEPLASPAGTLPRMRRIWRWANILGTGLARQRVRYRTPRDDGEAMKWYRLAGEQGDDVPS